MVSRGGTADCMASPQTFLLLLSLFLLGTSSRVTASEWAQHAPTPAVKEWADRLGKSLAELGRRVTREAEIKRMYKQLGALVVRRDGAELMSEIRTNIESMVKEKMAAVQCLMETAEEVSYMPANYADELENVDTEDGVYTYASAKMSPIGTVMDYPPPTPTPAPNYTSAIAQYRLPVPPVWYRPLELAPDSHFYDIPVNDTYSTVHVPTNVYDRAPNVIEAIAWSEKLDKVFASNYKADPSLTWQYFGSARGFMRQFPGIQWKSTGVDLYDCRTQPWYISAVTCSKDVILLMDVTGSMTGMRFSIARLVAHSLLDTLTSNDFVAVLKFSDTVSSPVSCFEDMLVQATKENVQVFKQALLNTTTEGYGNFTAAFSKAFELLERYRGNSTCDEDKCGEDRNQAIMLITDGVPGNLTETFDTYNRINETGEESIPVRVFTYLLGKEVTNVREIQWMACLNRGYYTHMQSLEEVREEALRYLNVIARPLVLQGTQHPIVWTHAYADYQDTKVSTWIRDKQQQNLERNNNLGFTQAEEDRRFIKGPAQTDETMARKVQKFELLTSVSIPVFDRFANLRNNETRTAELLGVAGLDVPLKLFHQLTHPDKIGVNGYAFIVTNNGYILMHPELRPVVQGHARDNFNSVDLTEIELEDDDEDKPRQLNEDILQLRQNMVDHKSGHAKGLKLKFSFDDMRRVGVEERDFYYSPIDGTPFTLGLAVSPTYGRFTVGLGEKFKKITKGGYTATNHFHGGNWRIHPDWIYCKHLHDSLHEFNTPEERLMHFLKRRDQEDNNWKWKSELPPANDDEGACGRPPVPEDAYYCNADLVERLILDAKAIGNYYGTDVWELRDKKERDAVHEFNVSMRFVATQSGLTRWQHVQEMDHELKFGDWNSRAIDEDWYRAAVLLHEESKGESYMFTVPFDAGENPETPLTGYSALYNQDGGFENPVAVVGFQLPLSVVEQHLKSISESKSNTQRCEGPICGCGTDGAMCYLLDSNGFVVVSEDLNDTGRFFGDVAPDAMATLHRLGVYRKISVFDYQALCIREIQINSAAAELLITPFRWIQWIFSWIVAQFLHLAANDALWRPIYASSVFYDDYDLSEKPEIVEPSSDEQSIFDRPPIFRTILDPCDKLRKLALLTLSSRDEPRVHVQEEFQATYDNETNEQLGDPASYRSLVVQRVIHTNLVLVVVDGMSPVVVPRDEEEWWNAAATTISYGNVTHPCYKLHLNDLPRRRLAGCLSHHPQEAEIEQCGRANSHLQPKVLLLTVLLLLPVLIIRT